MQVQLYYGDGFFGRSYYFQIGSDTFIDLGAGVGSVNEEQTARIKAQSILYELGIDVDISNMAFKSDGTL